MSRSDDGSSIESGYVSSVESASEEEFAVNRELFDLVSAAGDAVNRSAVALLNIENHIRTYDSSPSFILTDEEESMALSQALRNRFSYALEVLLFNYEFNHYDFADAADLLRLDRQVVLDRILFVAANACYITPSLSGGVDYQVIHRNIDELFNAGANANVAFNYGAHEKDALNLFLDSNLIAIAANFMKDKEYSIEDLQEIIARSGNKQETKDKMLNNAVTKGGAVDCELAYRLADLGADPTYDNYAVFQHLGDMANTMMIGGEGSKYQVDTIQTQYDELQKYLRKDMPEYRQKIARDIFSSDSLWQVDNAPPPSVHGRGVYRVATGAHPTLGGMSVD